MGLPIVKRERCRSKALGGLLALAIVLLFPAPQTAALEVGELRPQSALNQPFYGEIDLLEVEALDLDRIEARLANPLAFEQAGLERPAFLTEMRFTPMIGPRDEPIIQVTSRAPIREPYLALLIELLWPDGRLVKEYAVLLDPPAVGGQGQATSVQFPLRYGPVPAGVGLTEIGRRLAMPGVTLEQIALALYRNSPNAFVDGNINRLRQGGELIIPTRAELLALAPEAAREQYWAAVAGAQILQAPLTDVDVRLLGAGQETSARADTQEAARAEQTQVEAEGPAPAPEAASVSSVARLEAERLLMRAQSEASRQEATELRARVEELEARLSDIHRWLEQRNVQLAHLAETDKRGLDPVAEADTPKSETTEPEATKPDAAWRNALPAWALPLFAVALLLALLGLILHRRRRREEAAVALDPFFVTSDANALDAAGQPERQAPQLEPDWPDADTGTATPAVTRGAPSDLDSLTDLDDSSIAMPVVDLDDVATEDALEAGWSLEKDESGIKLDLARAYLGMGDPDAAGTILEEIVAEGDDAQRREAEALLAGLGKVVDQRQR